MHTKNALDVVRATIHERQIRPVGPIQAYQSDELMGQFRESIVEQLSVLRREKIDPHARKDLQVQGADPDIYPKGFCGWIRDVVMGILPDISETIEEQSSISLSHVKFRNIWAIQHEKYMQNAIQVGSWIIDAANDTCDRKKPPVVIERVENSGMRNPRDHADFCDVIEKYWGVRCYPNVYYPILAPFFPVLFSHEGQVGFFSSQSNSLDAGGIFDSFVSAKNFIFNSPYADRKLSTEEYSTLYDIDCLEPTPHSVDKVRRIFRSVSLYGPNRLAEIYVGLFNAIQSSSMEFRV